MVQQHSICEEEKKQKKNTATDVSDSEASVRKPEPQATQQKPHFTA